MAAASIAHPELIGRPRHAGRGIAQLHVGAAAHAADPDSELVHRGGFYCMPQRRARPAKKSKGRKEMQRREADVQSAPRTHAGANASTIERVIPAIVLAAGRSSRMGR